MNRLSRNPLLIAGVAALASYHLYMAANQPVQARPLPRIPSLEGGTRGERFSGPRIQVALLLDTSNSMDGLIMQAKAQLFTIVKELSKADVDGKTPRFEVALYEYGNDGLSVTKNYVRQVLPFTTDLDKVSEELQRLKTNGGEEYCGAVIQDSLKELSWSSNKNDMLAIFIAGNEPFDQGGVSYKEACAGARQKSIVVNTIFCGNKAEGERSHWSDGATLADGRFLVIDSDRSVAEIPTPYDKKLVDLNAKINSTYVSYGPSGGAGVARQEAADNAMAGAPASVSYQASRAQAKATTNYQNSSWDLVDAEKDGTAKVESMPADQLPAELKGKSASERRAYVDSKAKERAALQQEIKKVGQERDNYLAKEKAKAGPDTSLEGAILVAIRQQAKARGFRFK